MAKTKTEALIDIPVQYGDLSVGETTCRIGINVARDKLSVSKADSLICGKRLSGRITAVPGNGNPDQGQLITDENVVVAAFDVKKIGFNKKTIGFGLTFAIESVDTDALFHFSKRAGRLIVDSAEALPSKDKRKKADDDEDDDEV